VKRLLLVGLAFLSGTAVTAFLWPPYYDMAPIVPVTERPARAAIAVGPGIVVTAVGLELLVGLPLVSWFFTWTHNLATAGQAKTPAAAWRELQAREESSRRWRGQRLGLLRAQDKGHGGDPEPRAYANVMWEHREHGDEDPPLYSPRAPVRDEDEASPAARERSRVRLSALAALDLVRAHLAVTPAGDTARRARLLAEEARLLAIAVRFARAGPGDGRRLSGEASADLKRSVFGDEQPDR